MTRQEAIKKAVGAHGQWKARLQSAIETGKSDFTVESVTVDNNCEFGKWLYGDPKLKAETPAPFDKVRQLHADFHREVAKILALALKGNKAEALKAMGHNTNFARMSSSLTLEMMNWSKL